MANTRPYATSIAVALCTLVSGALPALGQSARGTVRASVTVLDPIGMSAASPLELLETGAGALVVDGTFEVTSPVPYVLLSARSGDASATAEGFSGVRAGSLRAVPQRVQLEVSRPKADGPVRLTYTIAVIL